MDSNRACFEDAGSRLQTRNSARLQLQLIINHLLFALSMLRLGIKQQ